MKHSTIYAHAYTPKEPGKPWYRTACRYCKEGPGHSIHLMKLAGMEAVADYVEPELPEDAEPEEIEQLLQPQLSLF